MCNLIITKGETFTIDVEDVEKVYRMTIDQKECDEECEYHTYHTFYYNPQTKMFSNAACFNRVGKKIFELEELQNIWQPSIRDMRLRHRNWVINENKTSREFILSLANRETAEKMYPVLTEIYLDQVEKAWVNAI